MKIEERKLDIDRWMNKVVCECGAWFWWCERREKVKCGGCSRVAKLSELMAAYIQGGK